MWTADRSCYMASRLRRAAARSGPAALALALRSLGYGADPYDSFLAVATGQGAPPLSDLPARLALGEEVDLFATGQNPGIGRFLPRLSRRLDAAALPGMGLGPLADGGGRPQSEIDLMIAALPRGDYRFIALDVETANGDCASICQIGIACVTAENVIETWAIHVDPGTHFSAFNTRLHGIGPDQVRGAPGFAEVIAALAPLLARHRLIQHSGFDRRAILGACSSAGLEAPRWVWHDSVRIARRAWPEFRGDGGHGLAHLKERLNLSFQHHDAGEDARAAALVVLLAEEVTGMTVEHLLSV